jgi:hypothetical protein
MSRVEDRPNVHQHPEEQPAAMAAGGEDRTARVDVASNVQTTIETVDAVLTSGHRENTGMAFREYPKGHPKAPDYTGSACIAATTTCPCGCAHTFKVTYEYGFNGWYNHTTTNGTQTVNFVLRQRRPVRAASAPSLRDRILKVCRQHPGRTEWTARAIQQHRLLRDEGAEAIKDELCRMADERVIVILPSPRGDSVRFRLITGAELWEWFGSAVSVYAEEAVKCILTFVQAVGPGGPVRASRRR